MVRWVKEGVGKQAYWLVDVIHDIVLGNSAACSVENCPTSQCRWHDIKTHLYSVKLYLIQGVWGLALCW